MDSSSRAGMTTLFKTIIKSAPNISTNCHTIMHFLLKSKHLLWKSPRVRALIMWGILFCRGCRPENLFDNQGNGQDICIFLL
jgi:hypothetical protein